MHPTGRRFRELQRRIPPVTAQISVYPEAFCHRLRRRRVGGERQQRAPLLQSANKGKVAGTEESASGAMACGWCYEGPVGQPVRAGSYQRGTCDGVAASLARKYAQQWALGYAHGGERVYQPPPASTLWRKRRTGNGNSRGGDGCFNGPYPYRRRGLLTRAESVPVSRRGRAANVLSMRSRRSTGHRLLVPYRANSGEATSVVTLEIRAVVGTTARRDPSMGRRIHTAATLNTLWLGGMDRPWHE